LRPFGNMHLLPRGVLREPISALARATACILTRYRADSAGRAASCIEMIRKHSPQLPVFTSTHVPYHYTIRSGARILLDENTVCCAPEPAGILNSGKTFGFSGIARNQDFQDTVKNLGLRTAGFVEFSDHHRYTAQDFEYILAAADKANARCLITTEKDLVRIPPENPFHLDLVVVGVRVSFGAGEQNFVTFLKNRLSQGQILNPQ
jgi:tetraacyldisaccharide 4'-kinase